MNNRLIKPTIMKKMDDISNSNLIALQDWSEFSIELVKNLKLLNHNDLVAIRNFSLLTYDIAEDGTMLGSINRLHLAQKTGTDRDENSWIWNAIGHDFDHDAKPSGKKPSDIIYAYVAEIRNDNYLVHYKKNEPQEFDLTENLTDQNGILVYDADKLERVSKNEHWFLSDPKDALLLIFIIEE